MRLMLNAPNKYSGDILVCEDNEIYRFVIKELLVRLGFNVFIAGNGREGLSFIGERSEKGMKPFDLIFMDILMPVMDGLEAAFKIKEANCNTPIVALTAIESPANMGSFQTNGIERYLNKPVDERELTECLNHYFTPVKDAKTNFADMLHSETDDEHLRRVRAAFAQRNRTTYTDICDAIKDGDFLLARRLAHTLRGYAAMIKEPALMEAARVLEDEFAKGHARDITEFQMETLQTELQDVLDELTG